jgi:hypothetical protein
MRSVSAPKMAISARKQNHAFIKRLSKGERNSSKLRDQIAMLQPFKTDLEKNKIKAKQYELW